MRCGSPEVVFCVDLMLAMLLKERQLEPIALRKM